MLSNIFMTTIGKKTVNNFFPTTFINTFLAPTSEEPYISDYIYLFIYLSETELFNSDFTPQYLRNWSSDWAEIWHTYQP